MTIVLMLTVALVAALFLTWPLLRRGAVEPSEAEYAVSIYRDQLDELDRDGAAGLIGTQERPAAEREIRMRAARAARRLDASVSVGRRAPLTAMAAALTVLALASGSYLWLGSPGAPDRPLAERLAEATPEPVTPAVPEALAEQAQGFERWWAEAQTYAAEGDWASAAEAYRKAAGKAGGNPQVEASYAEALTLANGNRVPDVARLIFAQVLVDNPTEPRARYYLALAKAQAQDFEGALADWQALLADSAPDAPWLPVVRRDIVNMARFTETDIAAVLPDATPAERQRAGAATDPAKRIAQLEATDPSTRGHEAWLELIRLKAAADPDGGQATITAARERFEGAPFVLSLIDEAEADLFTPRGPTDADVAAAADMTQDQRDAMIAGMVAGLAERLRDQPDDIEGWEMLIRSHAVLQQPAEAERALRDALITFEGRADARQRLHDLATSYGLAEE